MARKPKGTDNGINTTDYRHDGVTRKNIPPAKIAAEGQIPKVRKAKYYYNPHLSPELRFDPTGKTDRVLELKEKVKGVLSKEELELLDNALNGQQPWLEWAEKKEQHDRKFFEVDPIALHIHERISAQAMMKAAARQDVQRDLFADPQQEYQEAVKFYRHDIDWANRMILGDSLQVMTSLARREDLAGKVQMIYMDPPYGVKFASNFQPEMNRRDVKDKETDLTREPEMVKAYRDTWNLGVHSYLSYLRDRMKVSKELLHDTGSIFIQISEENLHHVREIMDEVFGSENLSGIIAFAKTSSSSGGLLASTADFLLWYAKDKSKVKYKQLYLDKVVGGEGGSAYSRLISSDGSKRSLSSSEKEDLLSIPKGAKIYRIDNLTSQRPAQEGDVRTYEFNGGNYTPGKGTFKTDKGGLDRLKKAERLETTTGGMYYVRYFDDFPVFPIANLWDDTVIAGFASDKIYVVQTSTKIIQRCILMTTDPGDLILDPTCGSGSTAYVAEQWGRRWITIDTSRVALSLTRQRMMTASFPYYKTKSQSYPHNPIDGFCYRCVPHITLGNIARNSALDNIFAKNQVVLDDKLLALNSALAAVTYEVRDILCRKFSDKEKREGKRNVTDADHRRWLLPKDAWQEWEVPFDADPDWPKPLQEALIAYRTTWRVKMDEINACIAANAEQEELVDQPEVVRNVVRVTGPFTVEGVKPEELSLDEDGLFDPTPNEFEDDVEVAVQDEGQNILSYLAQMVSLIRMDGVTFPNTTRTKFARIESLFEQGSGSTIHAEAAWEGAADGEPNNVAIAFGPQYGPVTAHQVEELVRASRRYDELVIAGFSFDAAAAAAIQESQHPKLKIHMAHIRPDAGPGMEGLLKDTPNSQLFTVFGQPEIKVDEVEDGEYQVKLLGVDIYDPLKGEVKSSGADKVAAWFLDSDFDGRCFCITQAFFPNQDAWDKIAKSLGSTANAEAFAAFKGTVSLPFPVGKHKRIAVKVIDPRGNEVMAIAQLGDGR
ncbi:MAG: site-specific DNA-methyltransferase [Deltaproteobacteria bacterium]|nr:MAG: site-specific DNA-methyltransferase [Deltaproteobacteria bacterium]